MQYRATKHEAPVGGLTELRVHGVGGATPEGLLGVPYTELVAGDQTAGFFQVPSWIPIEGPARRLEGYSWGGITSRARLRALWVLLLPFAFVNLAGWMFPHGGTASGRSVRSRPTHETIDVGLIRLLAMLATGVVAALTSFVIVDILGRRCAGDCLDRWYLAPWRWWASGVPSRIAISTVVSGSVMLAIALLAKASQANLSRTWRGKVTADPAFRVSLTSRQIWNSAHVAHRLGILHAAFGLAVVGGLSAQLSAVAAEARVLRPLMFVQVAVAVAALASVVWLGRIRARLAWIVFAVAAAAWAATALSTWTAGRADPANATMEQGLRVVFSGAVLALLLPWAIGIWSAVIQRIGRLRAKSGDEKEGPDDGETPGEASMPIRIAVPFLGIGLAVAFGAGMLIRFADLLGVNYDDTFAGRVAVLSLFWVVSAAVAATWAWLRADGPTIECVARRYPDISFGDADRRWQRSVGRAERMARITDHAGTVVIVASLAVAMAAAIGVFVSFAWIDAAAATASWILSFTPLVTVVLLQRLYRSVEARKVFGIIWDVASFWPRWFHPWAPPSYGERAVPHLRRRLEALTADGSVILSAHSQGAVVTAATLAPGIHDQRRLVWLTHGCPLDRLYARYFPEYFDADLFRHIGEQVGPPGDGPRWRNLWRHTDYIGGPALGPTHELPDPSLQDGPAPAPAGDRYEDVWVPDPDRGEPALAGDPRPRPLRHSNFFSTAAYRDALVDLSAALGYGPDPLAVTVVDQAPVSSAGA